VNKTRKAYCLRCGEGFAKLPVDHPVFCTQRCGMSWAAVNTQRHCFCPKHGVWTDAMVEGTECEQCSIEAFDAEADDRPGSSGSAGS